MSLEQVDARVLLALCAALLLVGAWVGRMEAFRKDTKDLLKEIRDDVKNIFRSLPSPAIEKSSPLRLTEFGEKLSNALDAKDWAKRTAPSVVSQVKRKHPYAVQDFAFDYVRVQFKPDDTQLEMLQTCAYENGTTMKTVLDVLAIELRNALLTQLDQPTNKMQL